MTNKHLHIVTHDVPFPADYGGVIDLFYKLKALHGMGVNIHLHCFTQGRAPQEELNKYCSTVHYYPRKKSISRFSLRLPFIVNSRKNDELIANLQKDDHPVLMEGIHTTYYLSKGALNNRKTVVRLHNVEFEYYSQLAKQESKLLKKIYFGIESRLLKTYEKRLSGKTLFLAVSKQDAELYRRKFNAGQVHYLPVFIPYTLAVCREGRGCFCLYHGNLGVSENEKAAIWLLEKVFRGMDIPFVIAGKTPSGKLKQLAHRHPNTCLVANPSDIELQDLIAKAQVHVLPSFNNTGIKLKLLNALFNGRHCVVNAAAVEGSGLEGYCEVATDAPSFQNKIKALNELPFTEEDIQRRQGLLQQLYNNEENAKKLMAFFWG